jgi:hypothetical protein
MHPSVLLVHCEFIRLSKGNRSKHRLGWPVNVDAIVIRGEFVVVASAIAARHLN